MIEMNLTYSEMRQAIEVGVQRQAQNIRDGRRDRYGLSSEDGGWTPHLEGACGEMAIAKMLGIYWSGSLGDLKADDVGAFHVRTRSKHHYDLILHPDDNDDRVFILVTGRAPCFRVVGWILARDGKRPEYWKDPAHDRAAFFVPQSALHPVEELLPKKHGAAQ